MGTNHAGKVIGGRYTLISQLATGGMGEVWSARDQVTARKVAVKVLKTELAGQEAFLARLRIEAQNAMQINHPNLATVLDHGELHGVGWIVMELVVGRTFNEFLVNGHQLTPAELLPILLQISQALQAASDKEVVHRDIKPSNILITAEGVVKLTDFGISTAPNQMALTDVGMVMGTAQYLSPEQAMGEPATHLSDMYSLGVIAYEAVAGRRPFTGKTQVDIAFAHVNESVPELPAGTPPGLRKIILKMLRKHPKDRYADFNAVIRELTKVAKQLQLSLAPHPLALPPQGGERKRQRPAAAGGRRLAGESRRRLAAAPKTAALQLSEGARKRPRERKIPIQWHPLYPAETAVAAGVAAGAGAAGHAFNPAAAKAELAHLFSPYGPVYGKRAKAEAQGVARHSATGQTQTWGELAAVGFALFALTFGCFYAASSGATPVEKAQSFKVGSLPALSLENTPAEVQKW